MSNSDIRTRTAPVDLTDCPMARAANLLGDRWVLLILREAFYGVTRFDDMRADMGVSRAVLSERLSRLVQTGILTRKDYREPGQRARAAYVLTQKGRALAPVLIALSQWGETHLTEGQSPVEFIDKRNAVPITLGFLSPEDQPVSLTQVAYRLRTE